LRGLHGDKAVWKLVDGRPDAVRPLPVDRRLPGDVDTGEDYEAVMAELVGGRAVAGGRPKG
jgi:molybdenum cofactor cytidylyltransferase